MRRMIAIIMPKPLIPISPAVTPAMAGPPRTSWVIPILDAGSEAAKFTINEGIKPLFPYAQLEKSPSL